MLLNAAYSLQQQPNHVGQTGFPKPLPNLGGMVPVTGMSHVMAVKLVRDGNKASQLAYPPEVDAAAQYWREWADTQAM